MSIKRWGFTPILILVLVGLVVASAYNYRFRPLYRESSFEDGKKTGKKTPVTIEEKSSQAFSSLTDREKVGLTLAYPVLIDDSQLGATPSADIEQVWTSLASVKPGFVSIFGSKIDQVSMEHISTKLSQVTKKQTWQPIMAVDHEGGLVQRLSGEGFTRLEAWDKVCGLNEEERLEQYANTAQELSQTGIGVVYGPVVDLKYAGRGLGSRSCSSDPVTVIDRSLEYIEALTARGILPVIKHYPGLGQSQRDLHLAYENIVVETSDLQPFLSLLNDRPLSGVMVAHAGIKDLYTTPCSLTQSCTGALLKSFPKALVFSDALDMQAVYSSPDLEIEDGDLVMASQYALEAGVDVLVFGQGIKPEQMDSLARSLLEKYQSDLEFKILVDDHARKIWDYDQVYWSDVID